MGEQFSVKTSNVYEFFLHVHFIQSQPLQSDNFFRWTQVYMYFTL